mgnify:FL=1
MARKQGDNDVQRLLENRPVSGGIQILPVAGDRASDLCDSLFNFELFNFEYLKCQFLGCTDNGEIFYNINEAKVVIENWRKEYNTVRPHSSLGYRPPAPEAIEPLTFEPFWFTSNRENMPWGLT